ncbi:MAG: hypothetical protein WCA00_12080 [Candidatus Acidiferrales bacterium]
MASRQEDKAMAGLLQKSLAAEARQGAGQGKDCPTPEILAAYFDRALDAQETARYDLHFSQCSHCREQLAAMARASGETGGAHEAPSRGWHWVRMPAWLMPAAAAFAVLFLIAGISLHYPKRVEVASEIAPPQANAVPLPVPQGPAPASPAPSQPALGVPIAPSALAKIPRNEASSANSARGKSSVTKTLQAQPLGGQKKEIEAAKPAAPQNAPAPPPTAAPAADENAIVVEAPPSTTTETVEVAPSKSAADSTGNVAGVISPEAKAKRPTAPKPQSKTTASTAPAAPATAAAASAPHAAVGSAFASRQALESAEIARTQQMQLASNLAALTIKTPDPRVFWMVADGGGIGRTEDGGATWKYKSLAVRGPFLAGSAPAAKVCWLLAAHNAIFRTADGKTWTHVAAPVAADEVDFLHIEAQDALTATVISADGRKFSTTDGGKSWTIAK